VDAWERAQFSNSLTSNNGMNDPDRDGMVNLLEQALGTPPMSAARTTHPVTVRLDASGRLVMTVAKPAGLDLSNLRYSVEFSSDLTAWSAAQGVVLQNSANVLEVRDHITASGGAKRYVRLNVSRIP
jgi:hypothetical protein